MLMFRTDQKISVVNSDEKRLNHRKAIVLRINADQSAAVQVAGIEGESIVWPEQCEVDDADD